MRMDKTSGRKTRLRQTTCLAAGLVTLGLALLPGAVHAQSLDTSTPVGTDLSLTGPTASTLPADPADPTASATQKPLKKKKKLVAADDAALLNQRAARLTVPEEPITAEPLPGRENTREAPLDGLRPTLRAEPTETPGISIGSFILRPSVNTSVNSETTKSNGDSTTRTFGQTDLKGTLTSDWSRHQLTVTGEGILQKNISGDAQTEPFASLNADLRLDLADDTVGHLTAGYSLARESATDPNAVLGAADQSAVQSLTAGASLERQLGLLRGLAAVDIARTTYSGVTLTDGSNLSLRDRDRNTGNLRLRVGYEISPALVPFLEASAGRTIYDLGTDTGGYERDTKSLGGKAGVQLDFGEKLKGELGLGYRRATFADARLAAVDAVVLDAAANWSPRRGTDITFGLLTSIQPSVVPGQSGYINRAMTLTLNEQVLDNLVAKLLGGVTWRNYRPSGSSSDEVVTTLGTGLAYGLNRYVDLTGDISWERTAPDTGSNTDVLRAGVGLTLKR